MEVGRLEVGTETIVDKSKSTKTILMDLFPGNTDIEGATIINACYGGTAALLNAFQWVESSGYDGRYAIVVAADIATYAPGPARPTCGCGAVAVLIGKDAPLVFNPKYRTTHASNTWDFYKPDHTVEYPTVDGALSQLCYYEALEDCYTRFCHKMELLSSSTLASPFDATTPDYFVFHAPYNKLVQKSYGRLFLVDARRKHAARAAESNDVAATDEKKFEQSDISTATNNDQSAAILLKEEWLTMDMKDTYNDRELENALKKLSAANFQEKLYDANYTSQQIGNTYTASVFFGIASLIHRQREELTATTTSAASSKRIVVFSYGSGALATMYQLQVYVHRDCDLFLSLC
jgi:hydroxymethylglutaryl-CoA synthase